MQVTHSRKFGNIVVWPEYMTIPGVSAEFPTRAVAVAEFVAQPDVIVQVIADGMDVSKVVAYIEAVETDE